MRVLRMGAAALAAIGLLVLVFLCLTGRIVWLRHADLSASIAKAGRYHVTIVRDSYGVPHIEGKSDADVAFGFAYAHSEDDFKTIQDVGMAVRGRLAQSEGLKAAPGDYLVHLMHVWSIIRSRYEKDLPADFRAVLQAYADGVNYYAALHPAEVKRDFQPMTGEDVAAGFIFKTPFFYSFDGTLKRLLEKTGGKPAPEIGSNGAAVAPSRSADGATRLLVNSHQPYSGAVAWYEAVLQSQQGWHVAGGFFPGSPFMLHGFNEHLGWANTVNAPDLVDLYRLKINPKNENQYWLDGAWHDFRIEQAAIRVKLWGPVVWTAYRPVYFAAQGPVMQTDHGSFAIRYAGMGEVRQALQYYRLDKAQNLDQWRAAMAMGALPSINYIYADAKGNIGYVYNGEFPVRKPGFDWQGYLPGTRSDLIWHDYLPFA
ncbi:MAG: penicillin acylase family protein, partial [Pseudomonadota bacterium]|nr:penicillin acylase family protein [Pseudomonadota bacterium]